MPQSARDILTSFTIETLPDLDTAVMGALELFETQALPKVDVSSYRRPMVVGSGNAEATGRIMFEHVDAIFASESTYEGKLQHIADIDGVVLISASGGKHAPLIARRAKELGKRITLVTNNPHAAANEFVGEHDRLVFPKNREPYTYNTSTYMGMILGMSNERATEIRTFIREHVDTLTLPDFATFDKYYLIVPPQFAAMIRMLQVKFIELFGRRVARDVETSEYVKHATTVVPSDELFLSFGYENTTWGRPENRLTVPLPDAAGYGAMMAVSYYVIGKIQSAHPACFKENIAAYTDMVSTVFGEQITPIVA